MAQENRSTQLEQAAYNNALWCDTVCRAHGALGEFGNGVWLNRHQTPRFYPNAITLAPTVPGTPAQQQLYDLLDHALPPHGAVKDSFCTLDLTPFGFTQLFVAQWIWRNPTLPKPENQLRLRWAVVQDAQTLAQWEMAWNGHPAPAEAATLPRVFLPALLSDPTIHFLAAYEGQQLMGGAIANRSGNHVGLSNLFYPSHQADHYWAGCIAAMMELYPALPMVGYERDDDLVAAQRLGFETVGPLQIWAR